MEEGKFITIEYAEPFNKKFFIIGSCLLVLHIVGLFFIGDIFSLLGASSETFRIGIISFVWYSLMLTLILIFFIRQLLLSIKSMPNSPKKKFLTATIIGIVGSVVELFVYIFVYEIIGVQSANQNAIESTKKTVWLFITSVVLAPVVEETLFRGVVFRFIRQKNLYLAIFLSALLFAFYHIWESVVFKGDFMQLVAMLIYFVPGITFSLVYEKTKNLLYPIMAHSVCNLCVMLYMFIV